MSPMAGPKPDSLKVHTMSMDPIERKALNDLGKRMIELGEGQTRFMDAMFRQMNEQGDRIRVLEGEVSHLRLLLKGLLPDKI